MQFQCSCAILRSLRVPFFPFLGPSVISSVFCCLIVRMHTSFKKIAHTHESDTSIPVHYFISCTVNRRIVNYMISVFVLTTDAQQWKGQGYQGIIHSMVAAIQPVYRMQFDMTIERVLISFVSLAFICLSHSLVFSLYRQSSDRIWNLWSLLTNKFREIKKNCFQAGEHVSNVPLSF